MRHRPAGPWQAVELGLSQDTLAELGLHLGADVPVFVRGRSAWAEGGRANYAGFPAGCPFLVIHPGIHVSTARFSATGKTRDTPINYGLLEAVLTRDFHNDCEAVAQRHSGDRQGPRLAQATYGQCPYDRYRRLLLCTPHRIATGAAIAATVATTGQVSSLGCNTSPLHQTLGETLAKFRETKNSGESTKRNGADL